MKEYTINAGEKGLEEKREEARKLCYSLNNSYGNININRDDIYVRLFKKSDNDPEIWANFFCEFGDNIYFGKNVFIHCNCVLNDTGEIRIGHNTRIGANCTFETSKPSKNIEDRRNYEEIKGAITIGEDVIIGNNVTIMHNVRIDEKCYIGNNVVIHSGVILFECTNIKEGSIVIRAGKAHSVIEPTTIYFNNRFFGFILNPIRKILAKLNLG